MTVLGLFGACWETWHDVPWKRGTWMPAMTWAPNPRSPAGTGCGQVWEAVLAEQAGRNAPPACPEAVSRRDSVSQAYLCFPRAAGLLELHSLTRNPGILLEDGLKVRRHRAPADAELPAIPEPGARSFLSIQL